MKENEPYKVAMELLQKYDPRQAMMPPQPGQSAAKGPPGKVYACTTVSVCICESTRIMIYTGNL